MGRHSEPAVFVPESKGLLAGAVPHSRQCFGPSAHTLSPWPTFTKAIGQQLFSFRLVPEKNHTTPCTFPDLSSLQTVTRGMPGLDPELLQDLASEICYQSARRQWGADHPQTANDYNRTEGKTLA